MVEQGVLDDLLARARHLVPVSLHAFAPNLLFTLLLALATGALASQRVQLQVWRLCLWLLTIMIPLAYTWTAAPQVATVGCHWGVPPWDLRLDSNGSEVVYNVLLLIPAGAAAWLWPDGPRRLAALSCAILTPLAIETGQLLVPELNRACQAGDVLNNALGAFIGWSLVAGCFAMAHIWSDGTEARFRNRRGDTC